MIKADSVRGAAHIECVHQLSFWVENGHTTVATTRYHNIPLGGEGKPARSDELALSKHPDVRATSSEDLHSSVIVVTDIHLPVW